MSEPIKVGDLVILIRTCGCKSRTDITGYIGHVTAVHQANLPCQFCGKFWDVSVEFPIGEYGMAHVPFSWVKRIPPLEDLQTYRNTDENPVEPVFDSTLNLMRGKA